MNMDLVYKFGDILYDMSGCISLFGGWINGRNGDNDGNKKCPEE